MTLKRPKDELNINQSSSIDTNCFSFSPVCAIDFALGKLPHVTLYSFPEWI